MRKYTEKIHAHRVQKMMEKKYPCSHCPAGKRYQTGGYVWEWRMWSILVDPCDVCTGFLDMSPKDGCPCVELGEQEAIERTWLALEEKGYLE